MNNIPANVNNMNGNFYKKNNKKVCAIIGLVMGIIAIIPQALIIGGVVILSTFFMIVITFFGGLAGNSYDFIDMIDILISMFEYMSEFIVIIEMIVLPLSIGSLILGIISKFVERNRLSTGGIICGTTGIIIGVGLIALLF